MHTYATAAAARGHVEQQPPPRAAPATQPPDEEMSTSADMPQADGVHPSVVQSPLGYAWKSHGDPSQPPPHSHSLLPPSQPPTHLLHYGRPPLPAPAQSRSNLGARYAAASAAAAAAAAASAGQSVMVASHLSQMHETSVLTLGIETADDMMCCVIPRGSRLPCESTQLFSTYADHQPGVSIMVFQVRRRRTAISSARAEDET